MRADSLTSPVLWLRLDLDHGPYRDTKAGPEQMVRVGELRDRPDLLHHLVEVVAARVISTRDQPANGAHCVIGDETKETERG
jgi:hypothetical protein